MNLMYFSPFC